MAIKLLKLFLATAGVFMIVSSAADARRYHRHASYMHGHAYGYAPGYAGYGSTGAAAGFQNQFKNTY